MRSVTIRQRHSPQRNKNTGDIVDIVYITTVYSSIEPFQLYVTVRVEYLLNSTILFVVFKYDKILTLTQQQYFRTTYHARFSSLLLSKNNDLKRIIHISLK